MFVQQSKYDDVVRQLAEQNAEVARLNAQLAGLTTNESALDALNSEKDLLSQQINTLTGDANTLRQENNRLTQQVTDLTTENETLRNLPGDTTALAITETENANGAAISDLDKLNEFVSHNSGDINARLNAINQYTNQLKK
jgi:predicted  nucleic acid-binding Zn-ribbon protein